MYLFISRCQGMTTVTVSGKPAKKYQRSLTTTKRSLILFILQNENGMELDYASKRSAYQEYRRRYENA